MTARMWRSRFEISPRERRTLASFVPPPRRPGSRVLFVDVVCQENAPDAECNYAVLLSVPAEEEDKDGPPASPPEEALCFLAFANVQSWGDVLRERGFKCIEAEIGRGTANDVPPADSKLIRSTSSTGDALSSLEVRIPFYPQSTSTVTAATPRQYTRFLSITGIDFSGDSVSDYLRSETLSYRQERTVPEASRPRSEVLSEAGTVQFGAHVTPPPPSSLVSLDVEDSRYPSLEPFSGHHDEGTIWLTGALADWPQAKTEPETRTQSAAHRTEPVRRPQLGPFGAPTFRFEDVEVLGFCFDLGQFGRKTDADAILATLVEPLNFHLRDPEMSVTPFRYRAASRKVGIELLRYGRMVHGDAPDLRPDDFTSQHELVFRVLVGRVDDNTAQARLPAVFAPAIFVDNPWSKVVGRELLGYHKQLASFCAGDRCRQVVSMDGRFESPPRHFPDLTEIGTLRVAPRIGRRSPIDEAPLVEIKCPQVDDLQFISAEFMRASLDSTSLAPWTQSDFESPEFTRSFAHEVVRQGFVSFDSIQATPVDSRNLPGAWISGTYTLDDFEVAFPTGIATLEFPSATTLARLGDTVPAAWQTLCRFLDRRPVSLPTGDWYRLKCSMRLEIHDLFDD